MAGYKSSVALGEQLLPPEEGTGVNPPRNVRRINVHLQNTINFLDALIRAGTRYELHLQPGQKRMASRENLPNRSGISVILDFFKGNL